MIIYDKRSGQRLEGRMLIARRHGRGPHQPENYGRLEQSCNYMRLVGILARYTRLIDTTVGTGRCVEMVLLGLIPSVIVLKQPHSDAHRFACLNCILPIRVI